MWVKTARGRLEASRARAGGRSPYPEGTGEPHGRDPTTLPRRQPRAWGTHIRPLGLVQLHRARMRKAANGAVQVSIRAALQPRPIARHQWP